LKKTVGDDGGQGRKVIPEIYPVETAKRAKSKVKLKN